jgi:biofilm protein TabA
MKNLTPHSIVLILMMITSCTSTPRSDNPADWTQAQVEEWFDSKEWLGDAPLQPDESIDKRKLAVRYHQNKKRWDAAFEFVRQRDFSLPVGDHALDGQNAFVRVGEYNSKNSEEVFYETHAKHTDIQFLVTGEEYIGRSELTGATVKDPYDEQKDIEFYEPVPDDRKLLAKPGTFFIFFPGEAHRPGVKVDESVPVKKMVIKVRE